MKNLKKISRKELKNLYEGNPFEEAAPGDGDEDRRLIRCCEDYASPAKCGDSCGTTCGAGYHAQYC